MLSKKPGFSVLLTASARSALVTATTLASGPFTHSSTSANSLPAARTAKIHQLFKCHKAAHIATLEICTGSTRAPCGGKRLYVRCPNSGHIYKRT